MSRYIEWHYVTTEGRQGTLKQLSEVRVRSIVKFYSILFVFWYGRATLWNAESNSWSDERGQGMMNCILERYIYVKVRWILL